jgi:NTP pyrophosphatase (non-canonical NTP hydrolase)
MSDVSIGRLQAAHVERQKEWCPDQQPDLSFRGNEMAGETGEACNIIKKLERERQGWRGSRSSLAELADELADVVHTAVLCAITAGVDLAPAVVAKFNATSEKNGLASRLQPDACFIARNSEVGFVEFINEDVPYIVRDLNAPAAILVDVDTRKVIGYRVYDPDAAQDPLADEKADHELMVLLIRKMGGHSVTILRNGERLIGWSPGKIGCSIAMKDLRSAVASTTLPRDPWVKP